ncbi:IPT/TIG domain-containing protein [Streptomyces sp. NL15-2K]|nr:IPT/TIG domain-containing protein [Kutzneria buriramensis]WKX12643.1 IPT/TIG domain-containing protein [Kutzneria buriramensis]GCB43150.1 flagellar hook-length control protein fliK [Streptomyces sp. NL15-2K]
MPAPVVSSVSPNQGPTSGGTTVTVTGTDFTGVTNVRFGVKTAPTYVVDSPTTIRAVTPTGTGTVNVTVSTTQGTSSQSVPFTYVAAPSLSALSPNQGPQTGATVTVTGTNLSGATAVRFGGVAASFTVDSSTRITAVAPARAPGAVGVTVTTPGGTSNALTFTYAAVPSVTGLSPNQGPQTGGTTVTVTGTSLSGATAVRFGGVAASFTVDSSTRITAVAPAQAAGAVGVTVTTPGGTSNAADPNAFFYYVAPPSLTGLAPLSGPKAGGTTVTLTGNDLLGATAVRFGGVAASFTVDSSTRITAVAPAQATGAVAVTVTTPGGTSNPVEYVYLNDPLLASLAPDQGSVHGGTVVTLTGSDLAATTGVTFGAVPATFTVASPTQITTVAPPGLAGPVSVTVTTPAGTSNGLTYTRIAAPEI